MATVTISGTNKLAERIVLDAQEEARAVLEQAQEVVLGIQKESEKAVSARRAELSTIGLPAPIRKLLQEQTA